MKTPIFSYPRAKSVVVCGDIHCDFLTLVGRMCLFLNMHDTLVIVAGDCGFGFEDYLCYKNLFQQYIEKYLMLYRKLHISIIHLLILVYKDKWKQVYLMVYQTSLI